MEIIVFEKEAYYKMIGELMAMFKTVTKELQRELKDDIDWINPPEAMQILNVGKTKLQELRNNNSITISKSGKKIKYSKKSIFAYLEKHKI